MKVSNDDIKQIAHLARLSITDDEITLFAEKLTNILTLVEHMNEVDTSNVAPLYHPLDQVQRLRADSVTETDQHQQFLALAPQQADDLFLVPQVIE